MSKISIRFYNDREVRAIWEEEKSRWWFSAIDIIRAINDEADYVKAGNYWRGLKKKLTVDGVELVRVTHEFKFEVPDGKKRAADLRYMKRWYEFYSQRIVNFQQTVEEIEKVNFQQLVEDLKMPDPFGFIPWGHHIYIFTKSQSLDEALFYINKVATEGWCNFVHKEQFALA